MITQEQIQQAVDILVREANPLKVILFGSHARGDARATAASPVLSVTLLSCL